MRWRLGRKYSLKDLGIFNGFSDWHSHILPGVDDGIPSMDKALEVLKQYENLGINKIWLTPHIMEDFPNKTQDLKNKYEELKSNWKGNIEIRLASENMLDNLFEKRLSENDFLPIGNDANHLLVETSYFTPPYNMDELLDETQAKGYHIVLAHPERYMYMGNKEYQKLKDKGILFQMNLLSIVGVYGKEAQQKAENLLKSDMIDFCGTDIHRLPHLLEGIEKPVIKHLISEKLIKLNNI